MLIICKGVFWTGGSLNPARSLAPAVAIHSFESTQWVYWVGPLAGSILAVLLLKLIKSLEYETANPDPEAVAPANTEQERKHNRIANGTTNGPVNGMTNGTTNITTNGTTNGTSNGTNYATTNGTTYGRSQV
jgi:hypothetical protein